MEYRKFSLFHLNLISVRQPSFDTIRGVTREEWLRMSLNNPMEFPYRNGDSLHWVPQSATSEFIIGIIEKSRPRLQHLPPEEGGAEVLRSEWQGAYVVIDPRHHNDGQKMAIENDIVGSPQAIASALFKHVNHRSDRPYETECRPIFNSDDFFEFLKAHGRSLKSVTFHFVVPNMWNVSGNIDKELKETGEETGTEKVSVTFKSRRGLDGGARRVTEGVDYASRGAGRVTAISTSGARFNSNKIQTMTKVEVTEEDRQDGAWLSTVWNLVLGRG